MSPPEPTTPSGGRARRLTQAERTARSERRILDAATRLIARKGYTRTTLSEIGKEAGYSHGLVTHRFGSKAGLLARLVESIASRFFADQLDPAVEGRSGIAALEAAVDTYLGELGAREHKMRALYVLMGEALGPVPELRPAVSELNATLRRRFATIIAQGATAGTLRADLVADDEAAVIVALLRGVAAQWLADADGPSSDFDLDSVSRTLKATLRDRLTR